MIIEHEFTVGMTPRGRSEAGRPTRQVNWVALTGLIAAAAVSLAVLSTVWEVPDTLPAPAAVPAAVPAPPATGAAASAENRVISAPG